MQPDIIEVKASDIVWPFSHEGPYCLIGGGRYPRRIYVDPFPCYPHDIALVRQLVDEVTALWPTPFPVRWYCLHLEDKAHTNGWFQMDVAEYAQEGKPQESIGSIVLQGKRIPIHPAMTRYVVAHEYGHAVEDGIAMRRGLQVGVDVILGEYREARGLQESPCYGGGNWHMSVGEVFANDWRLLIANIEPEFWPHPDVPRPQECPAIVEWWQRAREHRWL